MNRVTLILGGCLLLAACGQKGPLTLPDAQPPSQATAPASTTDNEQQQRDEAKP